MGPRPQNTPFVTGVRTRLRRAALDRAADAVEDVVDSAETYGPAPRPPVPLRTQATLEARAALLGLAQRLRDDDVVGPRAAAMTNELLLSPDSPLYTSKGAAPIWDSAMSAGSEIDDARRLPLLDARAAPRARLGPPAAALNRPA